MLSCCLKCFELNVVEWCNLVPAMKNQKKSLESLNEVINIILFGFAYTLSSQMVFLAIKTQQITRTIVQGRR